MGWLKQQITLAREQMEKWPDWMKRSAYWEGADAPVQEKPFKGKHACRVKSPSKYDQFATVGRNHNGKPYQCVRGKLKGSDTWEDQSYRYPTKSWTKDAAYNHCNSHGGKFEPAK